ncbi:DeoR/GlpR family DNA-binding transcription regulator [Neobacillus mesonae]|nr:DeoR/GlpR family DNA-binding transcription regulator [Neobacillus mesonae]
MLVAERYAAIVQLVNERGSIRVSELSTLCQVTEETIRRDLDRLEKEGRLKRSHGGAVRIRLSSEHIETPYREREVTHAVEKRNIALEALKYIEPGDRILLDASTTAWYTARSMPDIPLTVLTNSVRVVTELSSKKQIEVIATGGQFVSESMSFVGPLAERSLETYHVDKLFLSCQGVHLERGISETNELQARVKQKMIGMSDQIILLADSSKFGVQAFTHVSGLEKVSRIITNQDMSEGILRVLSERSIHVTIA